MTLFNTEDKEPQVQEEQFGMPDKENEVHNNEEQSSESSSPTSTPTLNLTFGIEVECVVAYPTSLYSFGRSRKDTKMKREIEEFLMANEIPTNELRGDDPLTYDMWTISEDAAIKKPDDTFDEGYDDVEIQSRILSYNDNASFDEVRKVLQLANDNFKLLVKPEYTCGLHVHIGNEDRGFPLAALKRYALLVTAFEDILVQLVPAHRFDTSSGFKCFCVPPSRLSTFQGLSLSERLEKIRGCEFEWQLSELMSPIWTGKNAAFNLGSHGDSTKRTIEHRIFAGTTDAEEIIVYVQLCAGLVEFAWGASDDEMEMVLAEAFDECFRLEEILVVIGRQRLTEYLNRKRNQYEQTKRLLMSAEVACLGNADEVPSLENSPMSRRSPASTSSDTGEEGLPSFFGEDDKWMSDEVELDLDVLNLDNEWKGGSSLDEQNMTERCQTGWSETNLEQGCKESWDSSGCFTWDFSIS